MALSIATNLGALSASKAASGVQSSMEVSMARLASGKRINSAADDAAGLAVLSKLEAALSGKEQAIRNAADGQGLLQTADSGTAEISNILNRMKELSVRAANGTTSIAEREALQSEADQLAAEISRIADSTSFNGRTPLSGEKIDLQVGASTEEQINVSVEAVGSSELQLDGGRVSFDTSANARDAIGVIDAAIEKINSVRGDIGASLNRVSSTIENLSNMTKNTKIAAGRVSDADVEDETTRRAKAQILQQSSVAMLAHKNASKGMVLRLIS